MSGVGNWFTSHIYSICVGLYVHMSSCVYMCSVTHSCLFVTPWTVAHQAPLSMGVPRQKNTAVGNISSPRGSSWLRDWTQVSCIGRRILYHWATWQAHVFINQANLSKKGHLSERKREVIQKAYTFSHQEKISSKVIGSWC